MASARTVLIDRRPLTARGVVASTLLGTDPPVLSARRLVRVGALFGIPDGTIRVAISRMVGNGELRRDERGYRLTGPLLQRRERQESGRHPATVEWDGSWEVAVVVGASRPPAERQGLRDAMRSLRLRERRAGVWMRPANLPADRSPSARATRDRDCELLRAVPCADGAELAAALWDLDAWRDAADELVVSLAPLIARLDAGDPDVLAAGFVESAAALRLLASDPVLPAPLRPPGWPDAELRTVYDRFDLAYRRELRRWLDDT